MVKKIVGKKKKVKIKWSKQRVKSKPILKRQKVTVRIREHEPAPYVSRYFDERYEEDKRQFYFK